MTKLKMGIIGVGGIAQQRHIPAYQKMQDKVEITHVYDVNSERARDVAEQHNIPYAAESFHDLFTKVDAVTICTPNKFHAEMAIAALEAGLHVLCEKPMAMTAGEAEQMTAASKRSGKLLQVAYHYRYTETARTAKQAIEGGEIGDPLVTRVQALRRRKVPGWGVFTNKELQGGGSLIDYGCHFLDLALWLLDDPEPVEVMGTTYNRLSKTPNQLNDWGAFDPETFDVDDHVSASIRFADGSSMLFECSWAANIKEDTKHLSISGADGGLSLYPFEIYQPKHGTFMTNTAKADHNETEAGDLQAVNFVNSCLGLAIPVVKAEEAMQTTRIIEAIYKSSETGASVKL
ncbi:Gfo/Idh/MocA family protein [Lentibacillus sediminis]|uniref:Gfo/Idh/MocA family protein n=1 Tax=Lentibacillus sediminis TaxID=1940529 RepID=UPI000C1C008C|nr:Gfo/Idh/MocA family oxidoreductase [Lentibacillus sediminis]